MATTFDGSTNCIYAEATPASDEPMTFAAWFKPSSLPGAGNVATLISICNAGSTPYFGLVLNGDNSDYVEARTYDGSYAAAATSAAPSTGTWYHGCAVFRANNDRSVFLDGGNEGTYSTSENPFGLSYIGVACRIANSGLTELFAGELAEVAVWDVGLSDDEVESLADGYSPKFIRPGSLVFYLPMVRTYTPDVIGNEAMTAVGTPTVGAAHSPSIFPIEPYRVEQGAAAAGISIPTVLNLHRRFRG